LSPKRWSAPFGRQHECDRASEPVHLAAAVLAGGVHGGEDVEFGAGSAEVAEPGAPAFGDSVGVVDLTQTVDRDSDQEVEL
jgi:hypothetical protein